MHVFLHTYTLYFFEKLEKKSSFRPFSSLFGLHSLFYVHTHQGCQIFLGPTYQNIAKKVFNGRKRHQLALKYIEEPENTPNGHKCTRIIQCTKFWDFFNSNIYSIWQPCKLSRRILNLKRNVVQFPSHQRLSAFRGPMGNTCVLH
jgi:hypothetical protein